MAATPTELTRWLTVMPKAELHLHLDGSLRPATALDLARTRQLDVDDVPTDLDGMRRRLMAPARCEDQAELLRAFDLPIALLQDAEALERTSAELVADVAADGTRYAEIRWAPSLHTARGLALADGIGAVVRGASRSAARHGIIVRLIAVALRTHAPQVAEQVVAASLGFIDDGLTGFDIAGVERDAPDPSLFGSAIDTARRGRLGISCHAGEWGGAAQVRSALAIEPWRIAHGAPAADDPELMTELRDRDVTLDLCPTSNLQIGVGTADHHAPLPRLHRAGVPVTINTDDRTVSDLTLISELERSVNQLGMTPGEIGVCMRRAFQAAFLQHDEELRAGLAEQLERWLVEHPAPSAATQR